MSILKTINLTHPDATANTISLTSDHKVGIGTTTPSHLIEVTGASNNTLKLSSTSGYSQLLLDGTASVNYITNIGNSVTADTSFYVGGSERMRITSAGNVGIGTTSPGAKLNVNGSGRFDNSAATPVRLHINNSGSNDYASIYADTTSAYKDLVINPTGGNVGIGTTSPSSLLDVDKSQDAETNIEITNTNVGSAAQVRTKYTTDGGLFTVGKVSDAHVFGGAAYLWNVDATNMLFATSDTERMRIDSSGNVIVGSTSSDPVNDGIRLKPAGQVTSTINGDVALLLNRRVSDGTIAQFRKDNVVVGSISVLSDRLSIGTGDTGLFFNDQTDQVQPFNTSTNAARDAAIDLGTTDRRFKDLYLSGGVYVGGTGSANYLDDYEEGTWTPVIKGTTSAGTGTYTHQKGRYEKIGQVVHFQAYIVWSAHSGASGNMCVGGLPYTPNATGSYYGAATIGYIRNVDWGGNIPNLHIHPTLDLIFLGNSTNNGTWAAAGVDSSGDLIISGHYYVT